MSRQLLTLLLLLNYLLVVCAGVVGRPARPVSGPFPYVHSHSCQQQHYLRAGCFDDCNGVQYTVQKQGQKPPLHQLLTSLKGLDLHCLPGQAALGRPLVFRVPCPVAPASASALAGGFHPRIEAPPRQG